MGLVQDPYPDLHHCRGLCRDCSFQGAVRPEPAVCQELDGYADGRAQGQFLVPKILAMD